MFEDVVRNILNGDLARRGNGGGEIRHHNFILDIAEIQEEYGDPYIYRDIVDRVNGLGSLSTIYASMVIPILCRSWSFLRMSKDGSILDLYSDEPEVCDLVDHIIADIDVAIANILSAKTIEKRQTFSNDDVQRLVFIMLDKTYKIMNAYLQREYDYHTRASIAMSERGSMVEAIPRNYPTVLSVNVELIDDIPF